MDPIPHISSLFEYQAAVAKSASGLVVIDFTATWCGPCKAIAPAYERLAASNRSATFFKCVESEGSAGEVVETVGIRGFPTFVLLNGGREVQRIVGADLSKLTAAVAAHGGGSDATAAAASTSWSHTELSLVQHAAAAAAAETRRTERAAAEAVRSVNEAQWDRSGRVGAALAAAVRKPTAARSGIELQVGAAVIAIMMILVLYLLYLRLTS